MGEKNDGPGIFDSLARKASIISTKAEITRLDAERKIKNKVHKFKAGRLLSGETDAKAKESLAVFRGELLDYLDSHKGDVVARLQAAPEQIGVIGFLLDSTASGSLRPDDATYRVDPTGPVLHQVYRCAENKGGRVSSEASFHVAWDPRENFPLRFDIMGKYRRKPIDHLYFLVLPEQATEEDLEPIRVRVPQPTKDWTVKSGVYQNGERIVVDTEGSDENQHIAQTDQYYLVGSFDGVDSGKTYWVYGSNAKTHSKEIISPKVA